MKLQLSFYSRTNVIEIARDLLGKTLFTNIDGYLTGGIITETEAYAGVHDRASHAYNGRRTARTEVMYMRGGTAYIYLCYGIHHLFNIVTGEPEVPHAVLIRGIKVTHGIDIIQKRTKKNITVGEVISGPGKVSKALGINVSFTGTDLLDNDIWLEDNNFRVDPKTVKSTPRIGVDYAGSDALLPYRFVI
ncbi:MAG: DNA-3-methyladenine glycosylase [Bacteroidales bacterium]|jgi:DNA-3-methyladenine glycosylase|nr:DNA-3-methyladenine glycosylase [Bacteroidales bacterium]